jgi:hypothetical protein
MLKTAAPLVAALMSVCAPASVFGDPPDQQKTSVNAPAASPSNRQPGKPRGVAAASPLPFQADATSEVLKTAPPMSQPSSSGPKPPGAKPPGVTQSSPQLFQASTTGEVLKPAPQITPPAPKPKKKKD